MVQGERRPQLLIPPHAVLAALRLQVPRAPAAICITQCARAFNAHQTAFPVKPAIQCRVQGWYMRTSAQCDILRGTLDLAPSFAAQPVRKLLKS